MSWFSDLAKGAEALLEKVDQSTASALQNEKNLSQSNIDTPSSSSLSTEESKPISYPESTSDFKPQNVQQLPGEVQSSFIWN